MENNRKNYDKIQLLNFLTEDIISFAAQKLGQDFPDYIDMNCGAIPQGEYEKIIDPDSPEQFLMLYKTTALKRLNLAASTLLKSDEAFMKLLEDYFLRQGKRLKADLPGPENLRQALELFDLCILCSCEGRVIIEETEQVVKWNYQDSRDADGLYWKLMEFFMQGIFSDTPFCFCLRNGLIFEIMVKKAS